MSDQTIEYEVDRKRWRIAVFDSDILAQYQVIEDGKWYIEGNINLSLAARRQLADALLSTLYPQPRRYPIKYRHPAPSSPA